MYEMFIMKNNFKFTVNRIQIIPVTLHTLQVWFVKVHPCTGTEALYRSCGPYGE